MSRSKAAKPDKEREQLIEAIKKALEKARAEDVYTIYIFAVRLIK